MTEIDGRFAVESVADARREVRDFTPCRLPLAPNALTRFEARPKHSLRWLKCLWLDPPSHCKVRISSILPMQTTVLRSNKLPWWDEQLVTVLHRVASLHPSQNSEIAVAFSDEAGEIYRTATINGARQLVCLGRELNALSLAPRAAPANSPQASIAIVFSLRTIQLRKS